jgi:hypothetical protein
LVYVVEIGDLKCYACGVCGLLYETLELAAKCEEFCKSHPGMCSVELAKYSIGYIDLSREHQRVFFKINPLRKCTRRVFTICKTGINIYRAC